MQALLYANLTTKILSTSLTGGGVFSWPKIDAGEVISLKLRLCETRDSNSGAAGQPIAVNRTLHSFKATLGRVDMRPESGGFQLKFGSAAESAGVNVTAAIAFDAAASSVASALNALTDVALSAAKPFTVTDRDGSWLVKPANGAALTITTVDNDLWPLSHVHITELDYDEGKAYEIRLAQSAVAETVDVDEIVPALPTVESVRNGVTNSGIKVTELQRVLIPAELPANFAFALKRGYRRSDPIILPATLDAFQAALAPLFDADENEELVAYEGENQAIIEFKGDALAGVNQDLLEVEVIAPALPDYVIHLDTLTDEMGVLMRKASATTNEIKLPLDLALELDDEQVPAIKRMHRFQTELTFRRPVSFEAFSAASEVNWVQPRARRSHLQYSASAVVTAQRSYTALVGDGSDTTITINHNLDAEGVHVKLTNVSTGAHLVLGADYDVVEDNANAITITFDAAPALNGVHVGIIRADAQPSWEPHEHYGDEVPEHEARLDALEAAVAALQATAGTNSLVTPSVSAGTAILEIPFRSYMESYPPGRDMLALLNASSSSSSSAATSTAPETLASFPLAALPKDGVLLPAVHDHIAEALTTILTSGALPTASSTYAGKVYLNNHTADVGIPGGGGVRGEKLRIGEYVACAKSRSIVGAEKHQWYKVTRHATTEGTFYPSAFERQLFSFAVSPNAFREKKSVKIQASLELALLTRDLVTISDYERTQIQNVTAQWQLVIEWGTRTAKIAATGGTFTTTHASNIANATAHGLSDGQTVKLTTTTTLPAPLVAGTTYYVRDATADTFKLALTSGGAAIDISDDGTGTHTFVPQTAARNLDAVTWHATPLLTETLHLTREAASFSFGAQVDRTASATFAAYKTLYGASVAADSTPTEAELFFRGRLIRFDIDDTHLQPQSVACLRFFDGSAKIV